MRISDWSSDVCSSDLHVTLDLGGQCKFGPDLEWVDELNYDVDPGRADKFYAAIRAYYPDLKDGTLQPAYAGIRPKIHGPGEPQPDFLVQGVEAHGVPGLINLYGIESRSEERRVGTEGVSTCRSRRSP